MFIVLAYDGSDGTTRYLPDLRRCQLPLTAETLRAAATPTLEEAQLFRVELRCVAGCIVLALTPSLPPGTEQHDWHPYVVNVFLR